MTQLIRTKIRWSGFTGAPGFTVLHFRDFGGTDGGGGTVSGATAQEAANRASAFAQALKPVLPTVVTLTVESEVDVVEDTNGELVTSFPAIGALTFQGSATGNYSAASGGVINWKTQGVRNGRRVRGRSFIVPMASSAYSTTGALTDAAKTTLQTAGTALANTTGSPDLMVYARPTGPGATDGAAFVVSAVTVPSLAAVLRSRRD